MGTRQRNTPRISFKAAILIPSSWVIPEDRPLAELPTVDELCMDLPSGMIVADGTGGD
jgi:hypothetical protein